MSQTDRMSKTLRHLACGLVLVPALAASLPLAAQSPPPDAAALREALLEQQPASFKRPPPEIDGPAPSARIRSATVHSRSRLSGPVRQAAHQAEDLPRETTPRLTVPRGSVPLEALPRVMEPQRSAAPELDYVLEDEFSGGMIDESYAGLGMGPMLYSRERFFVRAEYLLWWMEGMNTPPLLTTSSAGTAQQDAGILGLPRTSILFGGEPLADQARSGARLTLAGWFDQCQTTGVQASGTWLMTDNSDFFVSSGEFPILARPFFNVEPGFEGQDAELVAFPGLFVGQIDVQSESSFWSAEVLLRHRIAQGSCCRVDLVGGGRYASLDDEITISDNRTVIGQGAGLAIGTQFAERDVFETDNEFYGGVVGAIAEMRQCGFLVEGSLKLALGNTHSRVRIDGSSTATIPQPGGLPVVVNTPAGLLAQQTNIGIYKSDVFSVIPEVGVTVGYEILPGLHATAGYTFMYWTGVARAGDQIDTNLNLSQLGPGGLVGIPRPEFRRVHDDVWIQGVSVGLDYRF